MRIERMRLLGARPAELADFYARAFGAVANWRGLTLGEEEIEIACPFADADDVFVANETGFQHFAIVVADIDAAFRRLGEVGGWRPISRGGWVQLPPESGNAAAFKFRDPCGHPLELLQFPASALPPLWRARFDAAPHRLFHGLDHTALTVADATESLVFYARLGFECTHRQINQGSEQARLDGLDGADVSLEVLSLSPPDGARPGVELLAYRNPPAVVRRATDDTAAATATLVSGVADLPHKDPDGHRWERAE